MTDFTHLDQLCELTSKPLSRRLVETFKTISRDAAIAKTDYAQLLKNEMEAALQDIPDETNQSDSQ
jgi:hypothetical protein